MRESSKTQLLILCQLFYPELVSTGQSLTELAEELADLGVEVQVVCAPPTVLRGTTGVPKELEHKGIRVLRVWGTCFPKLNLLGRFVNQATFVLSVFLYLLMHRPRKPILVLTNPPFLAVACAMLKSLGLGAPYIFLIFDVYPDTAVNLGILKRHGAISRFWDWTNRFVFKHASAVVVIGRCMKEVIGHKAAELGYPLDGKLHTIHIWSDDRNITCAGKTRNPLVDRFKIHGKYVVMYSGNMGRFHDMETIMAAAELLRDRDDIVFLFVGEGHKKRWMEDFASEKGLTNCQFHTYVPREELGLLLSLSDVGLVCLLGGQEGLSVPSKTFGLMAAGVPVLGVMSEHSEIARVIREEKCGKVIQPGDSHALADAIVEFCTDEAKRKLAAQRGIDAIRGKYNLHRAAQKYKELIETLPR